MHMYDILAKKRESLALSREEIEFFIRGFTAGEIPDYQASALLMAICIQGMDERETADLTLSMAHSGEMADLSQIPGVKGEGDIPAEWPLSPLPPQRKRPVFQRCAVNGWRRFARS